MRILFLSGILPHPEGNSAAKIIYRRIKYLSENGYEIGLLCLTEQDSEQALRPIKPYTKKIKTLNPPKQHKSQTVLPLGICCLPSLFSSSPSRRISQAVGEMVKDYKYNLVIAELSPMGQYIYRNPWLPAVRRIISCHQCCSTAYAQAIKSHKWNLKNLGLRIILSRLAKYEFMMYSDVDHIIVFTQQQRHELLKLAPHLPISVIPHSVDLPSYPFKSQIDGEKSILFIGCYSNKSNQDSVHWFIKKVWKRLIKQHPDLKFYIVGRNVTPEIWDLSSRYKNIIVTGEVPDVRTYLRKATVFICPIRFGTGFRAKLLETMATGIPIVATSLCVQGIPAWMGDLILLADSPKQMFKSISLLLTEKQLRTRLTKNARELVEQRFANNFGLEKLKILINNITDID
jgi:polysaccharide biosynthesis protein PslH